MPGRRKAALGAQIIRLAVELSHLVERSRRNNADAARISERLITAGNEIEVQMERLVRRLSEIGTRESDRDGDRKTPTGR